MDMYRALFMPLQEVNDLLTIQVKRDVNDDQQIIHVAGYFDNNFDALYSITRYDTIRYDTVHLRALKS